MSAKECCSQRSLGCWALIGARFAAECAPIGPERKPVFCTNSVDEYHQFLDRRWEEGCHIASQLWREMMRELGPTGVPRRSSRSNRPEMQPQQRASGRTCAPPETDQTKHLHMAAPASISYVCACSLPHETLPTQNKRRGLATPSPSSRKDPSFPPADDTFHCVHTSREVQNDSKAVRL